MTQDSINALDDNLFLSGVKVISTTVDFLKETGIKINDKTEIKKNKLETDYPKKLTDGHRFLCLSNDHFISSFHFHVQAAHLDQGSA